MEREGESPPDDLALHFHHAGETDKAYHYATEAASRAESTGAIPEALRYLEIAREHTDDPEAAATLIGRMGHLHYLHQDLEEAAPLLELAAQRFRKQGKLSEALEAELERIDCLAKTNLLPLRECLEELEEIKKEAREQGEQSSFVKALDVEVNHRARVGDLEMIRKVLRQARRESGSGTNRTECRVQSILALNIYFACPEIGIRAAREAVRKGLSTNDDELILNALNRLILALHHQGLLNTDEGRDTLAKAEGRLETCGDLILKFFIRLNYAVWCLEIGDVAAADLAFRKAGRVIRGSKAQEAKAMLHLNLGEMELCLHGYENARHHYFSAENLIPETSPPFYHTIVNAGLGQCALHNGELTEARKREEMIGELPSFWSYDPTVVVGFKARMLLKRGEGRAAKELLLDAANSVRDRFIPAWLRLYIDFHRLERRLGDPISTHLLEEARDIATNLHLHERARQTKHLLQDSQSLR
jgi:tetratricopeptide (TPR) repeat protein